MEVAAEATLVEKEISICHPCSIKSLTLHWPISLGSSYKSDVLSEVAGGTHHVPAIHKL